jgi:hypothetical protein
LETIPSRIAGMKLKPEEEAEGFLELKRKGD